MPHEKNLENALLSMSFRDYNNDKIIELLDQGVDVNTFSQNGGTPLLFSVRSRARKNTKTFLSNAKINVNATDIHGDTALIAATSNGDAEIVLEILNHPATDVNLANTSGTRALVQASRMGYKEICNILVTHTALAQKNDGSDWENMLNHLRSNYSQEYENGFMPATKYFSSETAIILAAIIPNGPFKDHIIAQSRFNDHDQTINLNNISHVNHETLSQLTEIRSWHLRYLSSLGINTIEAYDLANKKLVSLLSDEEEKSAALIRNNEINNLSNLETVTLTERIMHLVTTKSEQSTIPKKSEEYVYEEENRKIEKSLKKLSDNPEEIYRLSQIILEKSGTPPSLSSLSLIATLPEIKNLLKPSTTTSEYSATPITKPSEKHHDLP